MESQADVAHDTNLKERLKNDCQEAGSLARHVCAGVDATLREFTESIVLVRDPWTWVNEATYGSATSNRFSICFKTSWSASLLTKEIDRPLVPKRPARPTR